MLNQNKLNRRTFGLWFVASIAILPRGVTAQEDSSANIPSREGEYDEPFPVSHKDRDKVPRKFRRQEISYRSKQEPGTLVVDTAQRFLYLVLSRGRGLRYGIGVGREGFAWAGVAEVGRKAPWPRWIPPKDMVVRDPFAAEWADGMPGGPNNPLGARALYLYANGVDTLYRIHGTNQPRSIGKAVSSGCVRLLNTDIIDLYDRVNLGTTVMVLGSSGEAERIALSHEHSIDSPPPRTIKTSVALPKRQVVEPKIVRKTNFNLAKSKQVSQ